MRSNTRSPWFSSKKLPIRSTVTFRSTSTREPGRAATCVQPGSCCAMVSCQGLPKRKLATDHTTRAATPWQRKWPCGSGHLHPRSADAYKAGTSRPVGEWLSRTRAQTTRVPQRCRAVGGRSIRGLSRPCQLMAQFKRISAPERLGMIRLLSCVPPTYRHNSLNSACFLLYLDAHTFTSEERSAHSSKSLRTLWMMGPRYG